MSNSIIAKEDSLYGLINYQMNRDEKNKTRRKTNQMYEIPCYQRYFSWEIKSCKELVEDIYTAYINNSSYYIGNIVYYKNNKENNKYYVVDGQQRITAIILLLCAFRKKYREFDTIISDDFINNPKAITGCNYKLKQNNYDDTIFRKIINKNSNIEHKDSKIYKAYNYFVNYFDEKQINRPGDYYNTIKNLLIVRIEIKGSNILKIAQTIFEKINSTGEPLSESALVRNYLLIGEKGDPQTANNNLWMKLEKAIDEKAQDDKKMDDFLKAYTILKTAENNTVVNNNEIYKEFKKFANKQLSIQKGKLNTRSKIITDLIHYAFYYRFITTCIMKEYDDDSKIVSNDLEKNNTKNNNLKNMKSILKLFKTIGVTEFVPLIMILFEKTEIDNYNGLKDSLDILLDFLIRYRVTGISKGGGALTTATRKLIKGINQNTIKPNKEAIHEYLSKYKEEIRIYPTDDEFENALLNNEIDKNDAKVLLYQLERKNDIRGIEFDPRVITLEHLMPETINPKTKDGKWWISHLGGSEKYKKVHDEKLWKLGNLAIIKFDKNDYISNSPWPNKIIELEKDQFKYTYEITKNDEWTKKWRRKQIDDRTSVMSKIIVKNITGPIKK